MYDIILVEMINMNFMQLFNQNKDKLTKSEIRLAEYIATHHELVIYSTMKTLGEKTGTGDATIVRLCKKIRLLGVFSIKNCFSSGFNQK